MKSLDILKRRDSCQFTYKVFESDLAVVCTKQEDYTQIISALSNMVSQYENGVTAYDLSNSTGIPFFLALEYLYVCTHPIFPSCQVVNDAPTPFR